jgi:hypothetical protein
MMQIGLIGIAAGAASALLFASVASGSLLSIPLFYLAPLPILIAAVGWSHLAGLIAALVAATSLAIVLGPFFFVTFLLGVGLPAWWLGYLALLARPGSDPAADALEWYPVGRIVLWAAVLGALIVSLAMFNVGTDAETLQANLRRAFERILRVQSGAPGEGRPDLPGLADSKPLIEFLALIILPTAAVISTMTNVIGLWLAARIVMVSGRLRRPWPDLAAITFPPAALTLLAAALAASFLPGIACIAGTILTASLLMAYALLGLAVMHKLSQPLKTRGLVLGGLYVLIGVFGWPILAMALVGLADSTLDLRGRAASKRGPPTLRT